jgi:hypothetical protein
MTTTDTLCVTATDIEKTISNMGLRNYRCDNLEMLWTGELETDETGEPLAEPAAIMEWDGSHDGYRGFLKTAKSLLVPLVYTKIRRFDRRREFYEFIDTEPGLSKAEQDRLSLIAQRFDSYDGYVSYILLAFRLGDVWHTYQEMAPWYKRYLDLMEGYEPRDGGAN